MFQSNKQIFIQVLQVKLAHKKRISMQRGIENSMLKSQISSVDFIISSAVYKISSVVFIISSADLRFQCAVFDSSLHIQYVFKALSVHIEYGMFSSIQANVSLQTTMTKAIVCLAK